MKKLIGIGYTPFTIGFGLLLLRLGLGVLMIPHGYDKLLHISEYQKTFFNFMGLGSMVSLLLTIFAEFFCSVFLVMGLFSRVAAFLLLITMGVAVCLAHNSDIFGKGEHAMLYLVGYAVIILIGPGRASMDGILSK